MAYEQLDHPTDLKLKITGQTLEKLFQNAAIALFSIIDERKPTPKATSSPKDVQVNSADQESLLVDWLNELLTLHDIENENYFEIKIFDLTPTSIIAQVKGAPSTQDKFDVKAATYHDLEIKKTADGYEAVVLFDI